MPRRRTGPRERVGRTSVTWTELVEITPDPETGARRTRRVSAATREECEVLSAMLRAEVARERRTGTPRIVVPDGDLPLGTYMTRWLGDHTRAAGRSGQMREASAHVFTQKITAHILKAPAALTERPLRRVTGRQIADRYHELLAADVAPSSIRMTHRLLTRMFAEAEQAGHIDASPMSGVRPPRVPTHDVRVWTIDEARRFAEVVASIALAPGPIGKVGRGPAVLTRVHLDYAALLLVMLATAIRVGEACVLRWPDVDLDAATITIRRSLTRTRTGVDAEGPAKTRAALRTIPVTPDVTALLRDQHALHRERDWLGSAAPSATRDGALIFPRGDGTMLRKNDASHALRGLATYVGVPELPSHGLRHTRGTLMMAAGINPKIVSLLLGHERVETTLALYTHPDAQALRSAVDLFDLLLNTPKSAENEGLATRT